MKGVKFGFEPILSIEGDNEIMVWMKKQTVKLEEFANLSWKQLSKLGKRPVVGLDIGSSSVKMIQLQKDDSGYSVTAAAIVDIVDEDEAGGKGEDVKITKAIHRCVQLSGVQTNLAVCGVCGPEVAVRHFEFPLLPQEEIPNAVLLEAKQICPFIIDDGTLDYQVIPDGENRIRGTLVAATNKLIKKTNQLAESASLINVLMDVDGFALLNCFKACEKSSDGRTTAVLNVGRFCTTLAIIGNDGLPFVRDLAYAGKNIVECMAAEWGVPAKEADKLLSGGGDPGRIKFDLDSSLQKACRKLIVDVTETICYYDTQRKSGAVEKIFVCGGFSLVKGFVELLKTQLHAETVLWNPLDKLNCYGTVPCADLLREKGPAMAVAAGLAMRSI